MENFFNITRKVEDLHHAYFFVGNLNEIKNELLNFFDTKLKVKIHGNPDFKILNFENLSVDDAKNIREASEKRNFADDMFFLVCFESISIEAQNSLLKTFEEPTEKTHFFFVSPQDNLLPTLKSRMVMVKGGESKVDSDTESILKLGIRERLERVKEITESISDEDSTKQEAIRFVNQVESEIYNKGVTEARNSLQACQDARVYLLDRGAPIKMILENLVLSI